MYGECAEYKCSACKKQIKNQVVVCKSCVKYFFHPGCVSKHKSYDKNREYVTCEGPFEKIILQSEKNGEVAKALIPTGNSRDRLGSTESIGSSDTRTTGGKGSMDLNSKIDWIVRAVKEMKDEVICRKEIRMLVKEVVQEEVKSIKQDLEDLREMLREGINGSVEGRRSSYSEAVKKKKENIIIIKPKVQQESETTKKVIKEKVDIKNI